jgi:hypothetical protein
MDPLLEKLEQFQQAIQKLEDLSGTPIVINNVQTAGTVADKLDLPLKDRLAQTNDEAMNRARLEANKRDQTLDNDGPEHNDEVVEIYIDEFLQKILKDL